MQEALSGSLPQSLRSQISIFGANPGMCELFVAKQIAESDLLVDIAWLLREPSGDRREAMFNSINVQRLTCLLKISIQNELVNVLRVILNYLDATIGKLGFQDTHYLTSDADLELFQEYVQRAKEILSQRDTEPDGCVRQKNMLPQSHNMGVEIQAEEAMGRDCLCSNSASSSQEIEGRVPLVGRAMTERKHCYPQVRVDWPRESWANNLPHTITGTRLAVFVVVSVVMCLGACIVLLHPMKPGEIAVSIKRCLFGYPFP